MPIAVRPRGVGTEVRNTNAKCDATLQQKTDELVKRMSGKQKGKIDRAGRREKRKGNGKREREGSVLEVGKAREMRILQREE